MKRIRCIVSMVAALAILLSVFGHNSMGVSANNDISNSPYGEDMLRYVSASYDELLIYRKNYGYMNFVEDIQSDSLALYLFEMADIFADMDYEPDKEKYMEVLINIIATYDLDNATDVSKQNNMDNLKDVNDYVMDFVELGKEAISLKTGISSTTSQLETAVSTAIDGIAMLAKNTDNWLHAISDLETLLQNYAKYDAFLKVIEENGQEELREAASTLRNSMSEIMKIKLNTYTEISNENFDNFGEFFFDDMFFSVLKQTAEYETDEGVKFFADAGDKIFSNINNLESSWELGTLIGKMIGNVTVGGENIINRVMEMLALYDISVILQEKVLETGNDFLKVYGTELEEKVIREYVMYSQYLIGCRIRGEYCIYSIAVNDAGLLSWFGKETAEDAKKWYQNKSENILIIQDNLPEVNIAQENVAVSVNWEMCYTDIKENDIVQQYAIITGVNEQNDILWRYESDKYEATELDCVSPIGIYNEKYYFVENGSITVLNIIDGSILWKNDEFGGAGIVYDFGEDGELYICGYYGPEFFMVDKEGKTLIKQDSFDPQYYNPYKIEYLGNSVRIYMAGARDYCKTTVIEVDLLVYTFEIVENVGSVADGEYVELYGILERNGAGNYVIKLDNCITFCNNENSYTVEEVGLTGVNSQYDFDSILGKRVCVSGTVMEAHTQYHYSQIMIVDGVTSLKVIN